MSTININIPAMGEGVIEATIIKWHVKQGDRVKQDDVLCDIATDKVDSEITSPDEGIIDSILFNENEIVSVGKTIAILKNNTVSNENAVLNPPIEQKFETVAIPKETISENISSEKKEFVFLSPLVKKLIQEHHLVDEDINKIKGSGIEGRITKDDILQYLQSKSINIEKPISSPDFSANLLTSASDTVIEMDRVRKLIAEHMIHSKHTSAHVTSFVEADVTEIVLYRNAKKEEYKNKYGINLTYLPFFVDAATKSILEFPFINASVNGTNIILHKSINIGIATALPNDNLIVPVIKNADQLNLIGIAKTMNDLAKRARANQLKPDEIQGGTFSITNLGTFGTLAGTPIINQPQVAILGIGAIQKIPAVIETPQGDAIAIRQKVILSLAYDHRIIDGMMAGKFLNKLTNLIENYSLENL
ncbi:MAG: dihydrolipoamide acetyltransferase family protein [Bacteroidales bacterium]